MCNINKKQRKQNLILLKAIDEVDLESAKEIISDTNLDHKELSFVIQDSIMLPEAHPLKLSKGLMLKGIKELLVRNVILAKQVLLKKKK